MSLKRKEYQEAYSEGYLQAFVDITSTYYCKQEYFPQKDGTVYNRLSGKYLTPREAYMEFDRYLWEAEE